MNKDNDALNVHPLFNHILHWKGPTQIHPVLWKFACGLLLTNAVRAHRQISPGNHHAYVLRLRGRAKLLESIHRKRIFGFVLHA
jgi:hypothetical protein